MDAAEIKKKADDGALRYMVLRVYNIVLAMNKLSETAIAKIEADGLEQLAATTTIPGADPATSDHLSDEIVHAIALLHNDARWMREAGGAAKP